MLKDSREGSLYITFAAYLDTLRANEKQKPESARTEIPTITDLADAVGVHNVTLTNIANGRIDRLTLETARKVLDEMWRRGFRPQITDFIRYVPPEE